MRKVSKGQAGKRTGGKGNKETRGYEDMGQRHRRTKEPGGKETR